MESPKKKLNRVYRKFSKKKLNLIKFSETHSEPEGRSYWLHVTTVDYGFHLYGEEEEVKNATLV